MLVFLLECIVLHSACCLFKIRSPRNALYTCLSIYTQTTPEAVRLQTSWWPSGWSGHSQGMERGTCVICVRRESRWACVLCAHEWCCHHVGACDTVCRAPAWLHALLGSPGNSEAPGVGLCPSWMRARQVNHGMPNVRAGWRGLKRFLGNQAHRCHHPHPRFHLYSLEGRGLRQSVLGVHSPCTSPCAAPNIACSSAVWLS